MDKVRSIAITRVSPVFIQIDFGQGRAPALRPRFIAPSKGIGKTLKIIFEEAQLRIV
jgi:hypothetical protein